MASRTSPHEHTVAALRDLEQKISDQVQCAICCEDYMKPKSLPCWHVFCLHCLEQLVATARRKDSNAGSIECPQCRKVAEIPPEAEGGVAGFPTAFLINTMLDVRSGVQSAQQLPTLAESENGTCAESENGICAESENETCCKRTSQKMSHYCQSCDMLLCASCNESDTHRSHRRTSLTPVVHQCKEAITSYLRPLKEQQGFVDVALLRVDTKSSHVEQQAEDTNSQIDAEIDRLQTALEQRREALKKEVTKITEGRLQELGKQKSGLKEVQSQLSRCVSDLEHCLTKGGNQQVISMRKAVEKRVMEISVKYHSQIRIASVEEANLVFLSAEKLQQDISAFGHVTCSTVCPTGCHVSGDGLKRATLGETASFTVTTFSNDGAPYRESLQLVSVELVSATDGSTQVGRLESEDSNQHVFTYLPVTKGKHQLHLKINGENVNGSPFNVMVYPSLRFRGSFVRAITGLNRPWGLSINGSGELVVIDNTGWRGVHIFRKDGTRSREEFLDSVAWSPLMPVVGVGDGQCYEPRGVAIDDNDNIFVVDGKAHRIQLLSSTGSFIASAGTLGKAPLQFNDPVGIAVSRDTGEVYVCDRRNNRIQVLAADFSYLREFGRNRTGPGDLHFPWDIDFDSRGNVFIADCGHSCIKVFTRLGRYLRSIGCEGTGNGEFQHLSSICFDKDDFLYAADKGRSCVSVFNPRGEFVMQFGTPGKLDGQLSEPMGVAVDDDGLVYVSDSYNGRVQIFQ